MLQLTQKQEILFVSMTSFLLFIKPLIRYKVILKIYYGKSTANHEIS